LAKSRVCIVLVTPSFFNHIKGEGIADKELSALLARGLSTIEESMVYVAAKLAELVTPKTIEINYII